MASPDEGGWGRSGTGLGQTTAFFILPGHGCGLDRAALCCGRSCGGAPSTYLCRAPCISGAATRNIVGETSKRRLLDGKLKNSSPPESRRQVA